jgi:hypothetical protein
MLHAGVLLFAGVDHVSQEDFPEGVGTAYALSMVSLGPTLGTLTACGESPNCLKTSSGAKAHRLLSTVCGTTKVVLFQSLTFTAGC